MSGFSQGFSLGTVGNIPPSIYRNHASLEVHTDFVETKLKKELHLGRIKGPYDTPPLPNFKSSPLGVVPKKEPNSYRLIHDLSFGPENTAVNHFIPFENSTVTLETFDDVVSLVLKAGRDCLLCKADIEDAFSILPMSPLDYHKLGFSFKGKFYFSRVLPMGASSSVQIFESFSKALQWILQTKYGIKFVSHIIDDFIFVGSKNSSEVSTSLQNFFQVCTELGIPIKHSKTALPTTCAIIHGIELDTHSMEARLPQDKLSVLNSLLSDNLRRKKIKLRELQSLLGHLNFACKAIRPGRCFLRRLYDLSVGHMNPEHRIKLNSEARADLKVWASFIKDYNGRTLLSDQQFLSSDTLQLYSDAAGSIGFACMYRNEWACGLFTDEVKKIHINTLELYPITLAVCLFGKLWQNRNILFMCDNQCIVHCLNKQTSKNKIIMKLIRKIVLQSLKFNFCFASKYISSKNNFVLDKLSRFQIVEARKVAPHMNPDPHPIPDELLPQNILL